MKAKHNKINYPFITAVSLVSQIPEWHDFNTLIILDLDPIISLCFSDVIRHSVIRDNVFLFLCFIDMDNIDISVLNT
jgi:hypothetical protein